MTNTAVTIPPTLRFKTTHFKSIKYHDTADILIKTMQLHKCLYPYRAGTIPNHTDNKSRMQLQNSVVANISYTYILEIFLIILTIRPGYDFTSRHLTDIFPLQNLQSGSSSPP